MACGTPVVVSDSSSLPEGAGDARIVVRPNSAALADALAKLLINPQRAREWGEKAYQRALEFSWLRTAAGWFPVIKFALG